MKVAWRSLLKNVIMIIGTTKSGLTIKEMGYSPDELKNHMEELFIDKMSWNNWGEWHIDHIIPVSKFKKDTPMSIVNSLDNLQLLWGSENLSKSNSIPNE